MTIGVTRSIRSLKPTSRAQGIIDPSAPNKNFVHRILERSTGNSPKIQKRRPSRLIMGKINRLVKVDRISPTAARFKKLTMFTHVAWCMS